MASLKATASVQTHTARASSGSKASPIRKSQIGMFGSAAAGIRAAVSARVAAARADHAAAALGALDRVLPRVEQCGLAWWGRFEWRYRRCGIAVAAIGVALR